MLSNKNLAGCSLLMASVGVVCGICLWLSLVTFNDMPPRAVLEFARRHANEAGYDVIETGGMLEEYVTQPDLFGGCEVKVAIGFRQTKDRRSVTVQMKRSWELGRWRLVGISVREQ